MIYNRKRTISQQDNRLSTMLNSKECFQLLSDAIFWDQVKNDLGRF